MMNNSHVPKWYKPIWHLLIPNSISFAILGISISQLSNLSFISTFLVFLISWIFLLIFEWLVHKYILHNPFGPFNILYRFHRIHHKMFTDQDMILKNKNDLYYILLPPYAILLVFGLVTPLAFIVGLLFGLNIAYLIMINSMMFFITYEGLHLSYHLPFHNFVLNKLKQLHTNHHNPDWQTKYNFNVTVPLIDFVMKTLKK